MTDKCPDCDSTNTERVELVASSPNLLIWLVECLNCDEWFNVTVEKNSEENKS